VAEEPHLFEDRFHGVTLWLCQKVQIYDKADSSGIAVRPRNREHDHQAADGADCRGRDDVGDV
jgi:hypothetical protein